MITWQKVKRQIWNLLYRTHSYIVHGIGGDIKKQIRLIKCIHYCISHTNYMCRMLMYCKLLGKKSVFAINYNYLSVKHDLCKRDWYCDVANLLGKVKFKYMSVCEPSAIISTLLVFV